MARHAVKRSPVKSVEDQNEVIEASKPTEQQKRDWDFVAQVVEDVEAKCGKGSALIPTSTTMLGQVDHWVSTRNFMIDWAVAGGLPMPRPIIPFGRITEIAGLFGTGKTTLLGHIAAETQFMGGVAVIIDVEHALDLSYMEKLGVDLSRYIVVQADTYEEGFHKARVLVQSIQKHDPDRLVCIGWDSVGATPTQAQMDNDDASNVYGIAAKVVGQNLQVFNGMIAKNKIAMLFTNHLYRRIGVTYGDPWESYAGEKFKFFATLRLRLARVGTLKEKGEGSEEDDDKQTIGHKIKVQVMKNKMAPYLRSVEVPCLGGLGFSMDYCVLEQGIKQGVIGGDKAWKNWETPGGDKIKWQGWRGFQDKMLVHPEYPKLVETVIRNFYEKAA
jgi:recombination protein RecA